MTKRGTPWGAVQWKLLRLTQELALVRGLGMGAGEGTGAGLEAELGAGTGTRAAAGAGIEKWTGTG